MAGDGGGDIDREIKLSRMLIRLAQSPDSWYHLISDSLNTSFRLVVGVRMIDVLGPESADGEAFRKKSPLFSRALSPE
jgi:hypothetical protein